MTILSVKYPVLKRLILHLKVTCGKEHPVRGVPTWVYAPVKLNYIAWTRGLSKCKSS